MTKHRACLAIERDLIASVSGDATPVVAERVRRHLDGCRHCGEDEKSYRALDAAVGLLRAAATPPADGARKRLLAELSDLRSRLVRYGVFRTPLGPLLIAATEQGISLVEYVERVDGSDSWLLRQRHVEAEKDVAAVEPFHGEVREYLEGRRTRLDWPLDLRFVRSDFQRQVLQATSQLPFGAISSYAGIAHDIGRPRAVRAVAGALRRNPVPIVVPCHRVVGSSGLLVGYAGTRIGLKQRLLGLEGVRMGTGRRAAEIDRSSMYAWYRGLSTYCLPTCGPISEQPIGTVTLFASRQEAEARGLSPCGDCRPDLHPLAR